MKTNLLKKQETNPDEPPTPGRIVDKVYALVSRWADRAKALHESQDELSKQLMAPPEAPLFTAGWEMFKGYTETLAKEIGDNGGWLEWYAWECMLGENPMEMTFPNGEKLVVASVGNLVDVILTNDEGNRMYWHINGNIEVEERKSPGGDQSNA